MAVSLDTLRIARRLKEAGLDERQAETITDVLRETRELDFSLLATKADIAELRNATKADIAELRSEMDLRFAELRKEMDLRFAELRSEMDRRFSAVQGEIDRRFTALEGKLAVLQAELASLKWMVSGIGFGILLLVIRSFWPGLG